MIFIYFSCTTDVSIMKREEDTGISILKDTYFQNSETELEIENNTDENVNNFIDGYGGYFLYSLSQLACPACMGEYNELDVFMEFYSYDPISELNSSWIPVEGSCTDNLMFTEVSSIPNHIGDVFVQSGGMNYYLSGSNGYYYSSVYESQYLRNSQHEVFINNNNSFGFVSIEGFDYIEPYEMLWVDPSYAFDAPISRGGQNFYWGPSRQDSFFNIIVAVYSWDGSQFLGAVSCSGPDNGFMNIPSSLLSRFQTGNLAAIHLSRHKVDLVPSSNLGYYIETHMSWEVVGTGYIE